MGERVSDSTSVQAPIETVHAVIIGIEDYPAWAEGMLEVDVLSTDDEGRPERARFRVDAKIAEVTYTLHYTYEGHDVSWTLVEGETISQLDGRYLLSDQGERTGVEYQLEADLDIPLPGFLKKRAAKQILDQGLRGLKQRAEASV